MYLEYSEISSNVIVLSMVILRDKVNIYMYPWKEVISLSFANVTAVYLFGMRSFKVKLIQILLSLYLPKLWKHVSWW